MKTPARSSLSPNAKCLLWGGYGYGNVGDELTLAAAIRDMKERFNGAIAVLSPVPGYTMSLFPGVVVVPYHALVSSEPLAPLHSMLKRGWLKAKRTIGHPSPAVPPRTIHERIAASSSNEWIDFLSGAEMLYLVGGGYLTDLFSLDQFLTPVEVAARFGVQIESAPLGIGPFTTPEGHLRLCKALAGAQIRVRDADSFAQCRHTGIKAEMCRDDGFRVREDLDSSAVIRRNIIGVNYFEQHGANDETKSRKWWHDMVAGLTRQGVEVEGFCFHNQISSDFSKTVELLAGAGLASSYVRPPDLDYRQACKHIASYRGIVTCRFHATVVANVLDIPTIATADGQYYTSKMKVAVAGASSARVIDPTASSVDDALSHVLSWFDS